MNPSEDANSNPALLINPEALKANMLSINYLRSLMAIAAGVAAGIAGLTNSNGFILFFLVHVTANLAVAFARMRVGSKGGVSDYLLPDTNLAWFAVEGAMGQALSFVLFWTLSFAMIHIF